MEVDCDGTQTFEPEVDVVRTKDIALQNTHVLDESLRIDQIAIHNVPFEDLNGNLRPNQLRLEIPDDFTHGATLPFFWNASQAIGQISATLISIFSATISISR